MRRGWRWLESLALSLASLAVCAALLEAGARLWVDLQARRQEHVMDPPISRYDPQLGWFHVAGAERRVSRSEFDVRLKFNKHGLRGPDRDYAPPPGVRRTLVLGDSFAEGYYVDEGQTVAAVLEGLLRRCGPHEVINAGVQGYSTDQEYLFYLHDGRRYGSRLVLLLFYSNDLRYNTSPVGSGGEAKPYFEVDDRGALVRRNDPVPPPDPSRTSRARPGAHRPVPWRGSMALRLLSNRTVDGNPPLHAVLSRLGLVEPVSREAPIELWPYGPGHAREVEEEWRRTRAILAALRAQVTADGATLALLYVPVRFEVNDAVWQLTRERYRLGRRWEVDRVFERLQEVCRDLDIPLIDPREPLRRSERSAAAYYTRDVHWNAVGNAIAAHAAEPLAREIFGCPGGESAPHR